MAQDQQGSSTYRVTHAADIVPRLPGMLLGYSHLSPEYWITSGNGVKVTPQDINIVDGIDSRKGNTGQQHMTVRDHHWYFYEIGQCG